MIELRQQGDLELLRAWQVNRDQRAIAELIRRHIDFVYAAARRQVRDAHLAEDVTQAVFILLLQKSHRITSEAAMGSWLFTTTRFAAGNVLKAIRRRQYYEQQAAVSFNARVEPEDVSRDPTELLPFLDQAIERLPRQDRACIVMSYLQDKSHRQIGQALGVSEDAARKRVGRALGRLRDFFAARGLATPQPAAVRMAAPAGLLESTLNVAILSQAGAGGAAGAIARGVTKMIFASKLKLAAAACIALTMGGLVTGQVLRHVLAPAGVVAATAAVDGDAADNTATVGDKVKVQFLGIARAGSDEWRSIDGRPIAKPAAAATTQPIAYSMHSTHQLLVKVVGPDDMFINTNIPWVIAYRQIPVDSKPGERTFLVSFAMSPGIENPNQMNFEVHLSQVPWKTVVSSKAWEMHEFWGISKDQLTVVFSPLIDRDGKTSVFVSMDAGSVHGPTRVVCADLDRHQYEGTVAGGAGLQGVRMTEYSFDLAIPLISSLAVQSRPYTELVVAKGISLDPAKPLKPQIVVESVK